MSTAEVYDLRVRRRPLIPPTPPRAPDDMTAFGRMVAMRKSAIATWGQRIDPRSLAPDVRAQFETRKEALQ